MHSFCEGKKLQSLCRAKIRTIMGQTYGDPEGKCRDDLLTWICLNLEVPALNLAWICIAGHKLLGHGALVLNILWWMEIVLAARIGTWTYIVHIAKTTIMLWSPDPLPRIDRFLPWVDRIVFGRPSWSYGHFVSDYQAVDRWPAYTCFPSSMWLCKTITIKILHPEIQHLTHPHPSNTHIGQENLIFARCRYSIDRITSSFDIILGKLCSFLVKS